MNELKTFTLIRYDFLLDGIFGVLCGAGFKCETLEHSYPSLKLATGEMTYGPKVPAGKFKCVRGLHRLEGMTADFETFEITGVPGHSNILFHVGNSNKDSAGCVLVGTVRAQNTISVSREMFEAFMLSLKGVSEFNLEVLDAR